MQLSCTKIIVYLFHKPRTMKFFISILSIFFLILTVAPCYCNDAAADMNQVSSIKTTVNNNDCQTGNDDFCTPFCHCANFHHPNFIAKDRVVPFVKLESTLNLSFYKDNFTPLVCLSFWRPPQS